jgi:hypothetical protein
VGPGRSGSWTKWVLDEVGLDEVGVDEVSLDEVGPPPLIHFVGRKLYPHAIQVVARRKMKHLFFCL